jgi:Mrp family chromosome partitioning ATPase
MELSDYGRILTRWFPLILLGTVLGLAVGGAIEFKSKISPGPTLYQGSSRVTINYVVLGGGYLPGMQIGTAATQLTARIHDPGALQINPRIPAPAITSITAFVDPGTGQIIVTATGPTAAAVREAVSRGAHYLVRTEKAKVRSGGVTQIAAAKRQVKHDKQQWLHYTLRIAQLTGVASNKTLAILGAKASFWQGQFTSDRNSLDALLYPAAPPAQSSFPGPVKQVATKPLSPLKTVFPAGIIGLALSFLLAAFLETRRLSEASEPLHTEALEGSGPTQRVPLAAPTPARLGGETAVDVPLAAASVAGPAMADLEPGSNGAADPVIDHEEHPLNGRLRKVTPDTLHLLAEPMGQTADLVSGLLSAAQPSLFVTSPTRDEPKVATSVGLASALALQGRRVVLVDADPEGALSGFFGLTGRPGLSDYLGYPRGSLSRLVYASGFTSGAGYLSVLPYGIRRPDSVGLVSDSNGDTLEAWASGLADLARNVDVVVVNGVSALDAPDEVGPAATTGGAIVVVQREGTGEDVTETYEVLRRHGARVFGMVVNPVTAMLNGHGRAANGRADFEKPAAAPAEELLTVGAGAADSERRAR